MSFGNSPIQKPIKPVLQLFAAAYLLRTFGFPAICEEPSAQSQSCRID